MFKRTFNNISDYFSFVKFAHSIFSLPFALIGFFLPILRENAEFHLLRFILVLLCVVFARNSAMGFNRYADREIDKKNPRTLLREIPRGIIRPRSALFFVILNCILFIVATFFINPLCFYLSPVALLVVLGYSFTKRITFLSHLFLGMGLALAPIGAYLSVTGRFELVPVLFAVLVLFWVAGFDIIYSLQDESFDKEQKLQSIPAIFGTRRALILSAFFHLVSVGMILAIGFIYPFGSIYWTGAVIFTLMIIYQHIIVKPKDLSRVNLAFFTLNGIASILFAIFVITDLSVK